MKHYYEAEWPYNFCYSVDADVVDEFLIAMHELGAVVHQIDAIPWNYDYKEVHGISRGSYGIYFF